MSRQPENISAAAPKTAASMHVAASDSAGLIAAINAANDEVAHPGTDTIVLAGGTYKFNVANNPWYGPNALPAIFSSITVEGNGATLQIVGEPKRLRFFYVGADSTRNGTANFLTQGAGTLTLRNLTLKGGQQKGGDTARGGGGAGLGGAIFNHGTVTLEAVTLVDNRAIGGISFPYDTTENFDLSHENSGGGGLGEDTASNSGRRSSGMGFIFIPPFASLSFLGNSGVLTGTGGGGFSPNPQGNGHVGSLSGGGNGGGAARDGLGGDGGAGGFPGGLSGYGSGGGSGAGGFDLSNLTSSSLGHFSKGGTNMFAPFRLFGGGGGGVGGGGGNGLSGGGGGFGAGGGCGEISGGHGGFGGGGGMGGGTAGLGGFGAGQGTDATGGAGAGLGGAIFNHGGTLTAINCTFTDNHALGGDSINIGANGSGLGGAIFNLNGNITLRFCSLAYNTVTAGSAIDGRADGGAVYNLGYNLLPNQSAGVTLDHCILANSSSRGVAVNDLVIHQPRNVSPATGGGTNRATSFLVFVEKNLVMRRLLDNGSLSGPAPLSGDPLLGFLQDNGGPTPTMLPATGSPVINAGTNANAPATDQRGKPRLQGLAVDLGAVEACPPITIQTRR